MARMSHSIDLKRRVIEFVNQGGRKTEAVRIFSVGRSTIYEWLEQSDLTPAVRRPYDSKLKKDELAAHVKAHPDALLRERAEHFGVHTGTVWAALQKMGIREKNNPLR